MKDKLILFGLGMNSGPVKTVFLNILKMFGIIDDWGEF